MASNPKLDSSSSSPDGVPYGSQRSNYSNNSNLERSGNNRDGHDGGRLGLTAGGGAGAANTPGAGGGGGGTELPPLSQVLLLEPLTVGEQRAGRHSELKRAINAAVGSVLIEDPSLGSVQSKPLEACGPEELKRIKASLQDHVGKARERKRHLIEAITKLDRFRNSLQSRKRSRPESSALGPSGSSAERSLSSLGVGDRSVASVHNMKSNSNAALPHSIATAEVAMPKALDKNKRVVPNKRVRTSMADTRPDGRPANLNLQRPSVPSDRDRDVTRVTPSNSLPSAAEEKERVVVAPPNEGREKTKMKGRRSGSTTKPDSAVAAVPNGTSEGSDREHKWSGQQHRMNADNRSRPSEGHGFRSGPVHGITSVHKAESSAQINGLPVRGGSKSESDGTPAVPERAERVSVPDRERSVSKNGIKPPPIREESHPGNLPGITKAKAARAPRSISFGGGGPSSHLARSSSFAENRERHPPPAKAQVQTQPPAPAPAPAPVPAPAPAPAPASSGPTNRKRPAPSRSSSPPAQWVGQRPQKMARVARRVNLMPGATLTREEPNVVAEGAVTREGIGANASARPSPGVATGSGVARRVSSSSLHSQPPSKPKSERVTPSVGLSESDESEDDGEKAKEKVKKQADWEQKPTPPSQKMASLVVPAKKTRVVTKEEGGDGVRRQGRSGRGAVAPRTSVVTPVEKVEVSANAKQLRSVRVGPEKVDRLGGRPPTKKDSVDRKPMTRPRRPVGNGLSEISGESDDDREELANAIKRAVNASGVACANSFWKQMEPYFAFLTSADLVFLRQQARDLEERDPALQIPPCGAQLGKTESMISSPPVSPTVDPGGGKSMILANGNIETDGSVTKLFHNMKERHEVGKGGRRGVSGGWFDKILPLSQRLLAALIYEGDLDEGRRGGEETCQDDSSEGPGDESPFRGSMSGSERVDGDSDGDVGRRDLERWNPGGREAYVNEGLLLPNGHGSRSGLAIQREDLGGEGDDILAAAEEDAMNSADQLEMGNGDEVLAGGGITGKEDRGIRSFGTVAGLTAWETQYQRMTVDDRIMLELQSIGLFPEPVPDLAHREDDEVSEELRKLQRELKEQVSANKERVSKLEKIVLLKKEKEERDRERFAVEKLVERAYSRRMGSRGSAGKSAAAKGAKSAGLAFAKRVLARVRAYEDGQSIFYASLRDLLFCVAPKESDSSMALSGGLEGIAPATALTGEAAAVTSAALQPPKPAALLSNEVSGVRPVERRTDVKSEKDIPYSRQQPMHPLADRGRVKEDGWPVRSKEREVLLEDAVGVSGMRDVNALGANVMGGTKGKRSERDRDGKGHGKESHARSDSSKGSRQEAGSVKPERKTKTKPRQKTAPLSKAVNGLLAKPTPDPVKDRTTATSSSQQSVGPAKSKEEVPVLPSLGIPGSIPETDDVVDLSNIPLPGIEDLGVPDLGGQGQDLGAWLQDFDEDAHINTDGDCLMGLQVPMDDLSDLGLMM